MTVKNTVEQGIVHETESYIDSERMDSRSKEPEWMEGEFQSERATESSTSNSPEPVQHE